MSINIITGSILGLVGLVELGLLVYFLRYEKTLAIKAYLAFIFGVLLWVFSNALALFHGNGDVSFYIKFAYLGGALIASSFLLFVHSFPAPKSTLIHALKYYPAVAVVVFTFIIFFANTFALHITLDDGVMTQSTLDVGLWAWTLFFLATWLFAIIEILRRFRSEKAAEKRRIEFLLVGMVISLAVGVLTDVIWQLTGTRHQAWIGPGFSVVWLMFTIKAVRV